VEKMITSIHDYIYTKQLDLDLDKIKTSTSEVRTIVETQLDDGSNEYGGISGYGAQLYTKYNLLLYPFDGFHDLYTEIKTMFHEICKEENQYYIQCWFNYYNEGDFIEWHDHWRTATIGWHGFFCVDVEPSKTSYIIPVARDQINVESKDNLLVIGKSAGDKHRTWPWTETDRPRITLAFDIIPRQCIQPGRWLNHWMPI
jgi:hypothetical protein